MRQHVSAGKLAEQELETSGELKAAKLQAIDRLLWGTKSNKTTAAAHADGTFMSVIPSNVVQRWGQRCNAEQCSSQQRARAPELVGMQAHMARGCEPASCIGQWPSAWSTLRSMRRA